MSTIRLVLIDDHPMILQGFKVTLESVEGFEVVGTAANGEEGLRLIREEEPDVVLLDIMLPGSSGLELVKQLGEELPKVRVILITAADSDLYLVDALRQGASGYLSKDSSKGLMEQAVRGALHDGVMLYRPLVEKAFGAISHAAVNLRSPAGQPSLVDLTTRELDVLRLLADGKSDSAIGSGLNLGERAVREHLQTIKRKMGTRDRMTTALQALRLGLVD